MPSTHLSLHYHIVFSTKDRRPFIGIQLRIGQNWQYGRCVFRLRAATMPVM